MFSFQRHPQQALILEVTGYSIFIEWVDYGILTEYFIPSGFSLEYNSVVFSKNLLMGLPQVSSESTLRTFSVV